MLPKINKILYATDLSDSAKAALSWAMSIAEQYDAAITLIHVMPDLIEEMSGSMGYDLEAHFGVEQLAGFNEEGRSKAMESVKERIKAVCGTMKDELPSCRVDLNHIIIKAGHPVQEIVAAAVEGNYDLVVLGKHGHGLIDGLLLGSVARGVVQKCPIPVLTIKLPAEA
jgi:nucleotide-binding universal stress UspA family protein